MQYGSNQIGLRGHACVTKSAIKTTSCWRRSQHWVGAAELDDFGPRPQGDWVPSSLVDTTYFSSHRRAVAATMHIFFSFAVEMNALNITPWRKPNSIGTRLPSVGCTEGSGSSFLPDCALVDWLIVGMFKKRIGPNLVYLKFGNIGNMGGNVDLVRLLYPLRKLFLNTWDGHRYSK